MLKRKVVKYLTDWKKRQGHKPLVIDGARQVGKTRSVIEFGKNNYKNLVVINFILAPKFKTIFDDGFEVDSIIKNISLLEPEWHFEPGSTLIFFDELQDCPNCATSLKSFHIDGRYDVICSGSLMGMHYKEIDSNAVGYKEDYTMYSMDFEEYLWAFGYGEDVIESLLDKMVAVTPLSATEMSVFASKYRDYMIVGGMPEIVNKFVESGNFSGVLPAQRQLLLDYEQDITKYAAPLDKSKILSVYRHIPVFLAKDNKKFQITKISRNARSRDFVGVVDWLRDAGIVNICYCLDRPELPLAGNYKYDNYKMYYHDNGLLIASLDDEAQDDLRVNRNFNTYKGAVFENAIGEALVKQGYKLYFYRNEKSTVEMDFFVRTAANLVPVEVKASNGASPSMRRLVDNDTYPDIKYGVKFCVSNIGFDGKIYTFPHFLAFLLRRFLERTAALS